MLDKSVPYHQVFMMKNVIEPATEYDLPEGFTFCEYKDGMALEWVRLQMFYELYDTFGDAIAYFKEMYLKQGMMIYKRLIFIKDENGIVIATGALWVGTHFGNVMHKIQGLAVHPQFRHRGLAKAIIARLYNIAVELECKGGLYTNVITWSYPAINLLFKMGFVAYVGEKPTNHKVTVEEYNDTNKLAWEIIMRKINEYNQKHVNEINEKFGSL